MRATFNLRSRAGAQRAQGNLQRILAINCWERHRDWRERNPPGLASVRPQSPEGAPPPGAGSAHTLGSWDSQGPRVPAPPPGSVRRDQPAPPPCSPAPDTWVGASAGCLRGVCGGRREGGAGSGPAAPHPRCQRLGKRCCGQRRVSVLLLRLIIKLSGFTVHFASFC